MYQSAFKMVALSVKVIQYKKNKNEKKKGCAVAFNLMLHLLNKRFRLTNDKRKIWQKNIENLKPWKNIV